jgi:hypothetical protein
MATATTITMAKPDICLTLTYQEAEFLGEILAHVGGKPKHSCRKHGDGIIAALQSVGVHHGGQFKLQIAGSITRLEEDQI